MTKLSPGQEYLTPFVGDCDRNSGLLCIFRTVQGPHGLRRITLLFVPYPLHGSRHPQKFSFRLARLVRPLSLSLSLSLSPPVLASSCCANNFYSPVSSRVSIPVEALLRGNFRPPPNRHSQPAVSFSRGKIASNANVHVIGQGIILQIGNRSKFVHSDF